MNDDQFKQLNDKIDNLGDQLGGQILKLYQHMQSELSSVRGDIQKVESRVNSVYDLVDANIKVHETDEQERLVMNHQLDRHEGWIKQIARQTKTKLAPEL